MVISSIRSIVALVFMLGLCGCESPKNDLPDTAATVNARPVKSPTVGIVDYQQLWSALGLEMQLMEKKETLQTEFNRVLNESRRGIVEKLNSFGGDPESLNEEQRQEIILMETKRRKALEKMERENNRSMQETTRWLNRVLDQKISGPIASIAKAKGFDLILIQPRSEVAYLRAGVDITELVLKKIGVDGSTPNNSAVPASEPENDSGDVNNKGL